MFNSLIGYFNAHKLKASKSHNCSVLGKVLKARARAENFEVPDPKKDSYCAWPPYESDLQGQSSIVKRGRAHANKR
ncbi:hypothetical protein AMTR_s00049p00231320 [Amborella trichopoda]|uniref:Uncharacterized protein n=1 Tax=Amborella trichopoda TaxID=13333 RepID=W1PV03_AMBTC|nr:hypothetical protein AMTR_s00049p00231320 [Amborella trichopoda]